MGAHVCQYGTTHKMCRCRKDEKIACPTPKDCAALEDLYGYQPKHKAE